MSCEAARFLRSHALLAMVVQMWAPLPLANAGTSGTFSKNGPAYEEAVGIVRVSKDLKLDDEPARPTVPARFSAPINYTSFDTGFLQTGKGFFAQDADEKAMRVETIRHTLGMDLPSNMTTLIRGNKSYNMNGGDHAICRQVALANNNLLISLLGQRTL